MIAKFYNDESRSLFNNARIKPSQDWINVGLKTLKLRVCQYFSPKLWEAEHIQPAKEKSKNKEGGIDEIVNKDGNE
jgi:hypothetical protein